MKKIVVSVLLILFLIANPSLVSIGYSLNSEIIEEDTRSNVTKLKQLEPVGTYEEYLITREVQQYTSTIINNQGKIEQPSVLIFLDSSIAPDLSPEIEVYCTTLENYGFSSIVISISGGNARDIKNEILVYWNDGYEIVGCVLIGDIPCEWFHHENDFYGPAEFPCDLFLMDLNGDWIDSDNDGMYDVHSDGSGDTAPEIYIGRIDASTIPGDEITILKKYFQKVLDFWRGTTNQTGLGLTYTDADWASGHSFRYDLEYAYPALESVWYPNVYRDDYVNNRIPGTYEFIQLSCHSSYSGHSFESGGWAFTSEIRNAPPIALFYNLFCCSSLRYTEPNCLGYAYIMDTDTPSLSVVGSTKTGSMLDFRYFYEPIGNGESFGEALKQWFGYEYPYDTSDISWFYGMTILGDPTLVINCEKNIAPRFDNITGPSEGITNESYEFFVNVSDVENDTIYVMWDWGYNTSSDWQGPFQSGDKVCASHIWEKPGEYLVRVRVKDEIGVMSGWSSGHTINIIQGPALELRMISGGFFQVSTKIKNVGAVDAEQVDWSITVDGGMVLAGKVSSGSITMLSPGQPYEIKSKPIIGFGKILITVSAKINNKMVSRDQQGVVFLFYVHVIPGGG